MSILLTFTTVLGSMTGGDRFFLQVVAGIVATIVMTPVTFVFGLPLLPFRDWIVSGRFPYLKIGYILVIFYGAILSIPVAAMDIFPLPYIILLVIYELVAVYATLMFTIFGRHFGFISDFRRPFRSATWWWAEVVIGASVIMSPCILALFFMIKGAGSS
jgi:hypothetical protein